MTHRRHFLKQASLLTAAAPYSALLTSARANIDDRYQIALSQYSLRAMFKDGSLDPLDFPAFTVDNFDIHAIDLWEGGLPKDRLDDLTYFDQLRERANAAESRIFLHMAGAYDCDPAKREASLQNILASMKRGAHLGCDFLRVFLKAPGTDEAAGLAACAEALKPLTDAAAENNITIAIEPGASELAKKGAFLAKVYEAAKHDALTLMPDFGKLENNVLDGTEAMLPYTTTISCKMHSFDEEGNQPDFDYDQLMVMIHNSGYSGYLAIEWEGKMMEPIAGVKASKALIKRSIAKIE